MSWYQSHKREMSIGDRIAEMLARRIGKMSSIVLHTFIFFGCFYAVGLNLISMEKMLLMLTTIVSLEAIYIGLFLQNSSNHHSDASDANAKEDARINYESEQRIEELQQRISFLEVNKLDKIIELLEKQAKKKKK